VSDFDILVYAGERRLDWDEGAGKEGRDGGDVGRETALHTQAYEWSRRRGGRKTCLQLPNCLDDAAKRSSKGPSASICWGLG
jgi:hypothetical protein